ncbi:hypothetical protein PILCRDRAFT_812821 [Piloderma croceum F 1598]|uniref:Uncharacterized protein n=1 Tax=Piloderma croceum (strain F 1598) TaxID=765440 RepID=A0A0C3GEA4_PILCF|nr:hypothetical protein PILCRDRAFT_812821 [Piloderma croceum F 1598]
MIYTPLFSEWEDETPAFHIVIRETLRLIKTGPALRRNLGNNLQFADKTIDKGAYVVYNMADVHLNEMVYSQPLKFDPSRYSEAGGQAGTLRYSLDRALAVILVQAWKLPNWRSK